MDEVGKIDRMSLLMRLMYGCMNEVGMVLYIYE